MVDPKPYVMDLMDAYRDRQDIIITMPWRLEDATSFTSLNTFWKRVVLYERVGRQKMRKRIFLEFDISTSLYICLSIYLSTHTKARNKHLHHLQTIYWGAAQTRLRQKNQAYGGFEASRAVS